MPRIQRAIVSMLLPLVLSQPLLAGAAEFPEKPVRIVVPFPAGAAADTAMRVVARKMSEQWRQPVVVDNRPGAHGFQAVTSSAADGYTLLLGAGSGMVTAPLLSSKLPYNPSRDFMPVGRVVVNVPILTTHPGLQTRTVRELVELARKSPGTLNYSTSGNGSPGHLSMEMLQAATGTKMVQIPYKGGGPAVNELVGGHVHLGMNAVPSVFAHIKAGRLVPLAVASAKRSRAFPQVPTMAEAGVKDFEYDIWYALFAPTGTPPELVARISKALNTALADAQVSELLVTQGAEPAPTTPQELARFIQEDTARWAKLVKERNLKLD
ncbi:tripartite tricarboxylate transporter substrate binding protein [Acidovorax sp. A1169]|uniref:Bug family tripartite tricarboxylate transporter substrate binding protein n=1 Tax=Acidovorax sp. A1169 TaxID=3059524 RepID=UPI00273786C4|nr:tripartite tricarboxylate transporter substrate binding protein [Acidovorax sp. A1169]MDP4073870.1 tripartite tricarboxylate transporter substrate binding protein [Acidovorax sp. A1169]